jgi:hypothetical protein
MPLPLSDAVSLEKRKKRHNSVSANENGLLFYISVDLHEYLKNMLPQAVMTINKEKICCILTDDIEFAALLKKAI